MSVVIGEKILELSRIRTRIDVVEVGYCHFEYLVKDPFTRGLRCRQRHAAHLFVEPREDLRVVVPPARGYER